MKLIYIFLFLVTNLVGSVAQELNLHELDKDDFIRSAKYEGWSEQMDDIQLAIEDADENWVYKIMLHRWNRFCSLFNIIPKNKELLIRVFDEALAFEPHSFCTEFHNRVEEMKNTHSLAFDYYRNEIAYMDSTCTSVLQYDTVLIEKLKIIDERDLRYRRDGLDNSKKQQKLDSINLVAVKEIIAENGYPGRRQVGLDYENSVWLVLQHSELLVLEEYLPVIKSEIENRNLNMRAYPYMYDRVCLLKSEPQLFGTQEIYNEDTKVFELYMIQDSVNIDRRRYEYTLPMLRFSTEYKPLLDGK